jgi:hypothetical protein
MRVSSRWAPAVAALGLVLAGCQANPTTAPKAKVQLKPGQARVTVEVVGMS